MNKTVEEQRGITGWHKSSYSENEGACVEQGVHLTGQSAQVAVRDTKHGEIGEILTFEASDWKAFVASL